MSETENKLEIVKKIIESGAIQIRDVDNGEEPFLYSSGNRGPGYVMIKGLCGQPETLKFLIRELAKKVNSEIGDKIDFIDGNVSGGMLPGWELRNVLSELQGREIPYVYLRETRKAGGHNELITGDLANPLIKKNMSVLVVEELVNYCTTTMNAVQIFRDCGYTANFAACILSYDQEEAMKNMRDMDIKLVSLVTLPEILDVAEENNLIDNHKIASYREFLKDSVKWQLDRGFVVPEEQAKEAMMRGYEMVKLSKEDAIATGAPASKINSDFTYWKSLPKSKPVNTVFVALDYNNHREILENTRLLSRAKGSYGFKINLDAMLGLDSSDVTTYKLMSRIKGLGKPVFLDIKMWNGERTMINVVQKCVDLEIDIVNVYPHVGTDLLSKLINLTRGTKTKIFVLTVLTHFDNDYCYRVYGKNLSETVRMFAQMAYESKADGIILPPTCLHVVRDFDMIKMCPGIRPPPKEVCDIPSGSKEANNQKQVATPKEAVERGANYLVIGSPITGASDLVNALEKILEEIN